MESALTSPPSSLLNHPPPPRTATTNSSFLKPPPSHLSFPFSFPTPPSRRLRVSASASAANNPPILRTLNYAARTVILAAAAASLVAKLPHSQARAQPPPPALVDDALIPADGTAGEQQPSRLSAFLESNSQALEALKSLLQQKLEAGEDEEALKVLERLTAAQPKAMEWKFLMARLLNEMDDTAGARRVFEEILEANPLSFEALFENALLMNRCGEGEGVIRRLESALKVAQGENKGRQARDVRLIMAQMAFLQKDAEEALRMYDQLSQEDPTDFRPYFAKGMIYTWLDRNAEASAMLARYRELAPDKFDVEGFLKSPLSSLKLFGTNNSEK